MTSRTVVRFGVTAVVAGFLLAGCGSNPPEPAPPSAPPSPTGPDPALVSWAGGYCGAVKDMRSIVYSLAKGYDITTAADLPKAAASLEKLDTALTAAISGLEKLPQVAQEATTLASGELDFYRKLHGKVTERGGPGHTCAVGRDRQGARARPGHEGEQGVRAGGLDHLKSGEELFGTGVSGKA